MGPKRRRKGKKKVGAAAAAGEEAAARDEEPFLDVDAGTSHAVAGEAAGGGGADGGSPASRAASPTAAGGQGGESVSGGSAPGRAATAQGSPPAAATAQRQSAPGGAATAQGAPPAAATSQSAPRGDATSVQSAPRAPATATVPQGSPRDPGVRAEGTVTAQSAPSGAAATVQSAPGGSATGQTSLQATAKAQSSPRAATTTKLDKNGSNTLEEEDPGFGDARWCKNTTGVDGSRDNANGKRDANNSLLSKVVLSWTIQDILLDDEVQKIPAKFKSLQHYLDLHSNMLIEEIRRNIKSSLLKVETTQCFRAFAVSFAGPPSIYYIDIDLCGIDNCQHAVKDGDLFFLSSQPLRGQLSGCFGIATDVGHDNHFQRSFKVLVSENQRKSDLESIKYVSFLTNIMESINILKAIVLMSSGDFDIINSIPRHNEKYKKTCACTESCALGIGDSTHLNNYNEEQLSAMTCIISKLSCCHNNSIELVWGSPGTGKTQLAAGLVISLLNSGFKMLVCVPMERDILIFLKNLQKVCPSVNFRGIVILNRLCNPESIKNCNKFHEMNLENRAQALYCCIFLWRSFVKELGFVLGLKPYCKEKCDHNGCTICSKSKLVVFSFSSFKEKVCALAIDVEKCSRILIDSLSDILLSNYNIEILNKLLSGISHLEDHIKNSDITQSGVEKEFGFASGIDFSWEEIGCNVAELNEIRMTCLGLIEVVMNSIELPQLEDRKDLEEFCIRHSRIIICTPVCSSQLRELKLDTIDILLVDDAAQIKEIDMLIPLSFSPRHIVMFGDHLHLQPMVKSEVCKEAGYASSLFQRLMHSSSENKRLTKQYMMDPSISQFVSENFYEGRLEDDSTVKSDDYNKLLKEFPVPAYGFFDISGVNELTDKGKGFVESSVIMFLLRFLCKGRTNAIGKINVGIICLCNNRVDALRNLLGIKYECHDRINIEVNSLDNLHEKWYDVVILSSVSDEKAELLEGSKMNVALSRSRYCLWIIGEGKNLIAIGDLWKKLIVYAKNLHRVATLNSNVLSKVMSQLNDRDKDIPTASALPKKDFTWSLSLNDLKTRYEHTVAEEFASEERKKRGTHRVETALKILKDDGVIGRDKVDPEDRLFKIASYEKVGINKPQKVRCLLEAGNIMVGHFRVSRNYFYLKPGEIYSYDKSMPYIHAKSNLPVSHAVMVIGDGREPMASAANGTCSSELPLYREHVMIQNSEGKRFGIDGLGRVDKLSFRGLYHITLPE
uniref:DNA2/NAM7 helicase-like C-terminal domain-containing protein n=1 Tax=Oryza punctata TaxID=4537 RepID=A0A0E0MHQ1_ORYPU